MTCTREPKPSLPTLAICYDFDRTLTPDDMQAQGFIQDMGYTIEEFWQETNELSRLYHMDTISSYMYNMVRAAKSAQRPLTKDILHGYGRKVALYPGVISWFERINNYALNRNIQIEHYVISSGLTEMIEATPIAQHLKQIYSCSFLYDEHNKAIWPAQVINFTNKTQFLFRIEKGYLDIVDASVNDPVPEEDLRIPFHNIVYIGDSMTDIPCMKVVTDQGGYSIGVYPPKTTQIDKVCNLFLNNRIKYFTPADYSAGSTLEQLIQAIIDHTATYVKLAKFHQQAKLVSKKNKSL